MKKKLVAAITLLLLFKTSFTQNVGIGTATPNVNAILDLGTGTRGFLMPRVSDANMNAMVSPAPGMMLYNTNQGRAYMYVGDWKKVMLEGDPFSLPYAGAGSYSSALFGITQTGPGIGASAIYGINLQNGTAVGGQSESGDGIVGTSNSGVGGSFSSTSGRALEAAGEVWLNNGAGKTMIGNLPTAQMQLHISNASDTALLLLDNNITLANGTNVGAYFKNGSWYTGAIKTTGTGTNVARMSFWTFASNTVGGLRERMSILDNGNVGINNNNPQTTLDINGTVKISGGSPGAGKVLTSDATGSATWSGSSAFAAYKTPGTNTTVNALSSVTVGFDVEDFDTGGSSYNPATNTFTAPVTGIYHFDVSVTANPQVSGQPLRLRLVKNGSSTLRDVATETQNVFSAYSISLSADISLIAGDQINVTFLNFSPTNPVIISGQSSSGGVPATYFNGHLIK